MNVIELAKQSSPFTHESMWQDKELISILDRFYAVARNAAMEEAAQICESRQTPGTGSVAILNRAADAIRNLKDLA